MNTYIYMYIDVYIVEIIVFIVRCVSAVLRKVGGGVTFDN